MKLLFLSFFCLTGIKVDVVWVFISRFLTNLNKTPTEGTHGEVDSDSLLFKLIIVVNKMTFHSMHTVETL